MCTLKGVNPGPNHPTSTISYPFWTQTTNFWPTIAWFYCNIFKYQFHRLNIPIWTSKDLTQVCWEHELLAGSRGIPVVSCLKWNPKALHKNYPWLLKQLGPISLNFSSGWFPVHTAHSQVFVYVFWFASCKTSQNVNILQQLTWRKFKVSKCRAVEDLCFVLSNTT